MAHAFTLQFDILPTDNDNKVKVNIHLSKVADEYKDDAKVLFEQIWNAMPDDYDQYGAHYAIVEDLGEKYDVKFITPDQLQVVH